MFPPRQIAELQAGPAQLTGRVKASGPPLRAPLSGQPCVYYQIRGRNHVWPWYDRLLYPPLPAAALGFWLDDGSGQLWIAVPAMPSLDAGGRPPPSGFECAIPGDGVRRTIYSGESPELDRLLDPGGAGFAPDAYLNAVERIITEGETLIVAGQVAEEISPEGRAVNYRSPPVRLVLQAQTIQVVTPAAR